MINAIKEQEYRLAKRKAKEKLEAAAPDLLAALKFVQTALANWRDGKDITEHPVHGHLHLEEVKYCIVDAAIKKAK